MATTSSNLHVNLAEHKIRQRVEKLRAKGLMVEARLGEKLGDGAAVLTDAANADPNGDDQRYVKVNPNF